MAVKADICNAFNDCNRVATIKNLKAEPSINYLAWLAAVILAPETGLENGGVLWEMSSYGVTQADL